MARAANGSKWSAARIAVSYLVGWLLLAASFAAAPVRAAEVRVYGEGVLSETGVVVQLFLDAETVKLMSFGVALDYDPADLAIDTARKNESDWYLGSGPRGHAYVDPDVSTDGEVVILGARLDSGDPREGVGGTRVALGEVRLDRTSGVVPALSLSFGRSAPFANFVTNKGIILDDRVGGVEFGPVRLVDSSDLDGDGVPDATDNCTDWPNPGQLDSDADGYGNACDGDFNQDLPVVGFPDLVQMRQALGKLRSSAECPADDGSPGSPCAEFDLDEELPVIGFPDLARFRQLLGRPPGPTCPTCIPASSNQE